MKFKDLSNKSKLLEQSKIAKSEIQKHMEGFKSLVENTKIIETMS